MADKYTGAGKLDERVEVLELSEIQGMYTWEVERLTWAQATLTARRNNFSTHGIGAAGVTFLLRRQEITLGHALRYRGHHCFITAVLPADAGHLAVEAALVETTEATYPETGITFPGVITEKYVRFEQPGPPEVYNANEYTHILVTPKAIDLTPGKSVLIGGAEWPIRIAHKLDAWKNEYEIWREVEH